MSTAPGGSAAGSGRCTMWVACRKSVDRRWTSMTRVLAAGRPAPLPLLLLLLPLLLLLVEGPEVAQERRAGSTAAAEALAGISTAGQSAGATGVV